MSYKNILLAIDLTEESAILINECIELARPLGAEITIFHDEPDYEEMCRGTGFIDAELAEGHTQATERLAEQFKEITSQIDYPIKRRLIGTGEYSEQLKAAIREYEFDLVVCGHHQGFWSAVYSSTGQLINNLKTPVLVIPLED
ncbi:universal stress protein [Vibrio sp. JC009]|uniref:universal stress protein n=1 Tax=Vibrio sp. JC009 TaxID=2912314 RepID=UPI0023AF7A5C|nr:universal stress protein [Vibrio sp. JC009]WED23977.1 universal stress protein [Vibrio sp. JC009]